MKSIPMTPKSLITLLACFAVVAAMTCDGFAGASKKLIRVEEDWSLTLGTPEPSTGSPQVGTQMLPNSATEENYAIFCINFQEIPTFHEGGLEIQLWEGDWNTDVTASEDVKLSTPGEVITWTQIMKISSGKLAFSVRNGSSASFGAFGGDSFRVVSESNYTDLDGYKVESSLENSGITFGSNRVKSLKIVEVRKHFSDGTVETDSTPKVVFEEM